MNVEFSMSVNDKKQKRSLIDKNVEESPENRPSSSGNFVKRQKRAIVDESDGEPPENQPTSSKNLPLKTDASKLNRNIFKGESDEKSPLKRRSDEIRKRANFFGVCLKCYQYSKCTFGEMSSFAFEHMCDLTKEHNENGLKEAITFLENQLTSDAANSNAANSNAANNNAPTLEEN